MILVELRSLAKSDGHFKFTAGTILFLSFQNDILKFFFVYLLRRCYTVKCFVQLVSQCFGDIVVELIARNSSQCNIPCKSTYTDRSMAIQSLSVEGQFQTAFVEEFVLVGILRVKVVNKYLCIGYFLYGKSRCSNLLIFFLEYFKPDNMLLRAREIAEIDVSFELSPNSFSTSWISFKDENGLAFLHVSVSCKSPWVKLVGFPPL